MSYPFPPLDQMEREWLAWRAFCREFETIAPEIDLNGPQANRFINAVRLWGEELVALRMAKLDSIEGALAGARARYDLSEMIRAGRIP